MLREMGHCNERWEEEHNPKGFSESAKASGGKKRNSSKSNDGSQKSSGGPSKGKRERLEVGRTRQWN